MRFPWVLVFLIFFSCNVVAQISKEDVNQIFIDANSGNHKAQNYVGGLYYSGNGVRKNYTQAARWYEKSAEKGNVRAITSLAFLYKRGEGVDRDYAKAKALFEDALKIDPNNSRAQIAIGVMYYYGSGVVQDYGKAAEWFYPAANKKNDRATEWLNAARREINKKKPIEELLQKAELGGMNAQHELAQRYSDAKDYKNALKWFIKAADQGSAASCNSIGDMFWRGKGRGASRVSSDYSAARKWFLKAKKLGSKRADENLKSLAKTVSKVERLRSNKGGTLKVLSIFGGLGSIVLYIVLVGWYGYFRKLSIIISPLSLVIFVMYYEDWVQQGCPGECNIRIDIFITYPLLFGVVIVGLLNLVRSDSKN